MRERVFEALAAFEKPASAYDIAEAVSKIEGRRVAANSVYRILDLFVGSNLARRVESANAYIANAPSRIACTTASSWFATAAARPRISMTTRSPGRSAPPPRAPASRPSDR
jgi:hypothetical protein